MAWTYETTKKGYAALWAKATLRPERKATVLTRARKIATNKARYQQLEARTGVPWWWIAVAHNLEGGGRWDTYLGNGQSIARVTTIVPKGRGPFKSFEDGAIDAIQLKGLEKIKVWDMPRALFLWEQFNGFGYVSKGINSPYVWSMTNLYTRGKYVRDHVYDPNAVSDQIGAAAMMIGLIELGEVELGKETTVAELQASLVPFARLAPTLISVLAGPAANLAVRVLSEVLEEVTGEKVSAKPEDVKQKVDELPTSKVVQAITKAEDTLSELLPGSMPEPVVRAEDPVPVPQPAPVAPVPVVVQPIEPPTHWIDRFLPKGFKTIAGIVIYAAGVILPTLGYVTPDAGVVIQTIGGAWVTVTMKMMLDRWLPVFAGFLKAK